VLKSDTLVRQAVSQHFVGGYMALRRVEWVGCNEQVHEWEIDQSMDRF